MSELTKQLLRILARYAAGALGALAVFKGVDQSILEASLSGVLIASSEAWWAVDEAKKRATGAAK